MRAAVFLIPLLMLSLRANSSEFQYISNTELKEELKERSRDIKRTEDRIAEINASEAALHVTLMSARQDGKHAEVVAASRTRTYYRFTKQGGAIKYLFSSGSVIEMLKRASFLKRLLTEGLEARREAGLRIAATEKRLEILETEKSAAQKMHAMLTEAYGELQAEMRRRRSVRLF